MTTATAARPARVGTLRVSLRKSIFVDVNGKVYEYADMTGAYEVHARTAIGFDGPSSLSAAIKAGRTLPKGFLSVDGWVVLDESGLVYLVRVGRKGHHQVLGAARRPGQSARARYTA